MSSTGPSCSPGAGERQDEVNRNDDVEPTWWARLLSNYRRSLLAVAILAVVAWAVLSLDFNVTRLGEAPSKFVRYIARMFPPDPSCLPHILPATLSTVRISIVGSLLGALLALPFAFVATRGVGIPLVLSSVVRLFLGVIRTIPSLVYAALLVSMVGLGEFAGMLAIAITSFGIVSKLLYESLEAMDPRPAEAVRSAGGNSIHVFRYALLPQAMPHFISASLYSWEISVRAAFVLGMVGAGGIGFELMTYIRLFEMRMVGAVLIVLILLVTAVDWISLRLRRMVI